MSTRTSPKEVLEAYQLTDISVHPAGRRSGPLLESMTVCKCWLASCSRLEFVDEESATWLHRLTSHRPSSAEGQVIETPNLTPLSPLDSFLSLSSCHFLEVTFTFTLTVSRFFPYPSIYVRHHSHSPEINVSRSQHLQLFE